MQGVENHLPSPCSVFNVIIKKKITVLSCFFFSSNESSCRVPLLPAFVIGRCALNPSPPYLAAYFYFWDLNAGHLCLRSSVSCKGFCVAQTLTTPVPLMTSVCGLCTLACVSLPRQVLTTLCLFRKSWGLFVGFKIPYFSFKFLEAENVLE